MAFGKGERSLFGKSSAKTFQLLQPDFAVDMVEKGGTRFLKRKLCKELFTAAAGLYG